MTDVKIVSVDSESVKAAFAEAIKEEATKLLRETAGTHEVRAAIVAAFQKRWHNDKDTWLEQEVRDALHRALWQGVQSAVEASGLQTLIETIVQEHVASPDFREALTRRAIETVQTTTFYVKPSEESK